MNSLIQKVLLIIIFLLQIEFSIQNYTYEVNYITVPLDHFSFTNNVTFKLRYLINDSFWNSRGPIFFYTGNEGAIDTFAQHSGFMWEIAPEFQALLIFAEHRYYGESLPFGNKSFSEPKYLGYLSSAQALADYVYLIEYLQEFSGYIENNQNVPVIAFGGSYGGMLAAWLRMKYPSSIIGAIASSAPIWQFQGLVNCEIFNRIISFVFRTYSRDCPKVIKDSWPALRLVTSSGDGRQWLTSNWKLCKPVQTNDDVQVLTDWLEEIYGNLAMVNYPYPSNFVVPLPAYPVKAFCKRIHNVPSEPRALLKSLGRALQIYTNFTQNATCVDITQSPSGNIGDSGWDFQACTEMIMPMCSDNADMFENEDWNYTKYAEECFKKWKVAINRPDLAVLEYGGRNLRTTSNIVFSNGLLDPWSGGGVLHDMSDTVVAVVMPDTAHHLDLRGSNPADPVSVVAARTFHKRTIRQWLRSYYREGLHL